MGSRLFAHTGEGAPRRLSPGVTSAAIFSLGWLVSLAGDACHVASGTTMYLWPAVPNIWRSAAWFPFLVGASVLGAARAGAAQQLPTRKRTRVDVLTGTSLVLGLYALTAVLRGQPMVVSVTLCSAIALAIWTWWDASVAALSVALSAAVLGPLAEIAIAALGASRYASDADGLWGVAPWLPALYFAAGAVASGLWRVIEQDG